MRTFLGFDIGGSKVAWGVFNEEGELQKDGRFPTPESYEALLAALLPIIKQHEAAAVGVGAPCIVSKNHRDIVFATNLPFLAHHHLVNDIESQSSALASVNNDAQCALIGEVWQGSAQEFSSAVMLTLGTGVGGALMQKRIVRPYPLDASQELCRLVVDPSDLFPARTGQGTLEALIGGHNLEKRFGVSLSEMAIAVRKGDAEAIDFWKEVSQLFLRCIRTVHAEFSCKNIIVGGVGGQDLSYYLQDTPPCPVITAALGQKAGLYGAVRVGMDYFENYHGDWK